MARWLLLVAAAVPFVAGISGADPRPRPQPAPSASAPATGWPATWPAGKLKIDWATSGEQQPQQGTYKAKLGFTDAAGKHHDISMTSLADLEITELTFDGQPLHTVPEYRALSRYLGAANLSLGAMNSDKALSCIRPDDDDASHTESQCGGAHNRPSYPANSWTQGSPTPRTQTPKLDYTKPENWPSGTLTLDPWIGNKETSFDDAPYEVDFPFIEKANGRRHRIFFSFGFISGKVVKLTFNGQELTTVPQYRALAKWLTDHALWGGYRPRQTLECTRANEDNAIKTNPSCAGWTGPW